MHCPGDVDSITQITLTPPGDGAVTVYENICENPVKMLPLVRTCKCTKYTKFKILTIVLDVRGPKNVDSIT